MVFANYGLPHRLLVNRALRKESDVLRERIAAYQEEKKNKIADANKEIEIALADANSSFEKAKKSFGAQLAHDPGITPCGPKQFVRIYGRLF